MPATAAHHISPFQQDEDFINKSLLASLDAEVDTEPVSNTDDPEHSIPTSYSSTSNSSSSGSPSVNFPISHHAHLPRSESPSEAHKQQPHALHSQETFYPHPGLYTGTDTFHRQQEFVDEYDAFANNTYRNSFNSYPNTTRSRHQATLNTPYRETPSYFPTQGADMFVTSPTQSQLPAAYETRNPYDFTNGHAGGTHKSYQIDQFNTGPTLLHNQGKAQQPALPGYSSSAPPTNGIQLSSQTPYGPHLPTSMALCGGSTVTSGTGPANNAGSGSGANVMTTGEEISTIFVVGFPEDMQEREFVNMFTFSQGFEAATLKIPNKEYAQYPQLVGAAPGTTLASGLRPPPFTPYAAQNDPYNLVTVDGGRDGAVGAAWPSSDDLASSQQQFLAANGLGGLTAAGMVAANAAGATTTVSPRKQIIGFAKFKTREEAVVARDNLQGRRVDIEKGAVLKAEMAKKNLHTKRGVGNLSVPPVTGLTVGLQQNSVPLSLQQPPHLNGLDSFGSINDFKGRDTTALARPGGWRDSITLQNPQQLVDLPNGSTSLSNGMTSDQERRRENLVTTLNGLSFAGSSSTPTLRGARERVEEERKKESQREKDLNLLNVRATNAVAFDPFHTVGVNCNTHSSAPVSGAATPSSAFSSAHGPSTMLRQISSSQGTTSGSNSGLLTPASTCTTPTTVHTEGSHSDASPMIPGAEISQQKQDEIVGPWDRINLGFPPNVQASRPRSETQGSSSPMPGDGPGGPVPTQNGLNALGHIGSLLNGNISLSGKVNGKSELSLAGGILSANSGGGSNTSTGNTSPTLPSPSGLSHGSSSSSSSGTSASTTGATSLRGSVDQNPPINTLYVGNLPTSPPPMGYPPDYLEETLREVFSQRPGYRQLSFRQKAAGPMCFVEFEDVAYATQTKAELSGNTLRGLVKNGIRLSYSKNPLGVRASTSSALSQHQPQPLMQSLSNSTFQQQHHVGDGFQARLPNEFLSSCGGQQHRGNIPQPSSILRRGESTLPTQGLPHHHQTFGVGVGAGGNSNPNTFLASPPPRFYSTSPGGVTFASMSTPLTGASSAFVPRAMAANAAAGGSGQNGGFANSPPNYSPFGVAFNGDNAFHHSALAQPHSITPEQQQMLADE